MPIKLIALGERAVVWLHECDNCGLEHSYAEKRHDNECGDDACAFCEWLLAAEASQQRKDGE